MERSVSAVYFKSMMDIVANMPDAPATLWPDILAIIGHSHNDLSNPKLRIPLKEVTECFDLAEHILKDPIIGFKAGSEFRISTFAERGSILAYSQSLADAVNVNTQYNMLVETVGQSSLERAPSGDYMLWDTKGLDQAKHRHMCDAVMGGYTVTAKWLGWSFGDCLTEIGFRHGKPDRLNTEHLKVLETVSGARIGFGQSRNYLKFADQIIDRELPAYNPHKRQKMRLRLDMVMRKVSGRNSLKDRVFLHISNHMKSGTLSEGNVATALGINERNLREELKEQGLSYRKCVDQVRQTLCQSYMQAGQSLTEIALTLGYNDQAAFTRAFKRWYGVPPSKYKAENIGL